MAGLFNQLMQYFKDAAPGGALNPEVSAQDALDSAAMSTMFVPIVGDVAGLGADAYRMYNNPEERTAGNAALMGLGALPFVPNMGTTTKVIKEINPFYSPGHPLYAEEVLKPIKDKLLNNEFTAIKLKNGTEVKLIKAGNLEEGASLIAVDSKGNIVGRLDGFTNNPEFHPSVYVDDSLKRQGLATKMYDMAEKSGAKIPDVNNPNAMRSEEGQAFRMGREAKKTKNTTSFVDVFLDPFADPLK